MLYELPNGKTVDIPLEIFFLDDVRFNQYIQYLMADDMGFVTENFFHNTDFSIPKDDDGFPDDVNLLFRDDI